MSTDDGDRGVPANPGGPRYNRPRRYPVQTPSPPDAEATSDVTRQNPTLAEAAQQHYGRRSSDEPTPPVVAGGGPVDLRAAHPPPPPGPPPGSQPYPYPAEGGPAGYPPPGPEQAAFEPAGPPPKRAHAPSTRVLVIAAAVVVALAVVIGVVVGLSGGDDDSQAGGPGTPGPGSGSVPVATTAPSTAATPSTPAGGGRGGGAPPATAVCANLGNTAPFTSFVARPRPAARMPVSYVEPQSGTKIAVCVGVFRAGAGAGRGRLGYLAEYEQLPATQYALTLKTLGWMLVPNLPRPTYRNTFRTTVTLVQQGTSLVTVVGDGT